MTAPRRRVVVAALAAVVLSGACGGEDGSAPTFEAVDLATGATVSSSELRGSTTLIATFATWCVPCERELPAIEEALPAIEATGTRVVAVTVDAPTVSEADVVAMIDRLAPSLTVWRDDESSVLAAYGATLMPFSVVVDASGEVIATWSGSLDPTGDDFLEAIAT